MPRDRSSFLSREDRYDISIGLIDDPDPKTQEVGWQLARYLRVVLTTVKDAPLEERRPGVYANTDDPAFLAALE